MDAAFLTRKIEAAIRAQEAGPALVPSPLYATSAAPEVAREIAAAVAG
jgi:hypothetical protein